MEVYIASKHSCLWDENEPDDFLGVYFKYEDALAYVHEYMEEWFDYELKDIENVETKINDRETRIDDYQDIFIIRRAKVE